MQDSALMRKLSSVLSRRVIKFLQERAKAEPKAYLSFFSEFGQFIKEGVCSDFELKGEAAKLLRFETSTKDPGEMVSLDDYISRMVPEQDDKIYYLVAPSRASALSSAYMEACRALKIEVLLLTSTIDEFAMANLHTYSGKELLSAEKASLEVSPPGGTSSTSLSSADADALCTWLAQTVPGVAKATPSSRLTDSPAIVVGHESAAMRRMMGMMEAGGSPELAPQKLEINARHPLILRLAAVHASQPSLAAAVAQQLLDNALVAAGLMDDPRGMLANMTHIMAEALKPHAPDAGAGPHAEAEAAQAVDQAVEVGQAAGAGGDAQAQGVG
mmetsp:Transcript_25857/g.81833  ORF Transcript_25857/g.81833 Transcript_25857/m.81833 type:complete len:329 (-) Transcript_25857:411-1397(-)